MNKKLISNIRSLLKKRGWKAIDLAKQTGLPHATVSRLLSGVTKEPQYSTLREIAHAFGMTVEQLTGDPFWTRLEHFRKTITKEQLELVDSLTEEEMELIAASRKLRKDDPMRLAALRLLNVGEPEKATKANKSK